ncbi:MAG: 16S rRNA (cytidine(1402)-2'-O)-methyltransferase [Gemmatimonadota bacterium]
MASLFLVSTPIGNLEDVTQRARRVLGEVHVVFAEDTRRTRILLEHLELRTPLRSLHQHNEASRVDEVLELLAGGQSLALVSDAGTPGISDPGHRLVEAVLEAGHQAVPIPGPSAVLAALTASGLPSAIFTFLGFPPRKGKERRRLLERVSRSDETVVLFESPHRLVALLDDLWGATGGDGRTAAVTRELTKLHEEVQRGTLEALAGYYREHPPRGEITLVVSPRPAGAASDEPSEEEAADLARRLRQGGMSASAAARELVRLTGLSRNEAYRLTQELEPS